MYESITYGTCVAGDCLAIWIKQQKRAYIYKYTIDILTYIDINIIAHVTCFYPSAVHLETPPNHLYSDVLQGALTGNTNHSNSDKYAVQ